MGADQASTDPANAAKSSTAIPSSSLADLVRAAAVADAGAALPGVVAGAGGSPPGEISIELPSIIDAATLDATLDILGERCPVIAFKPKERALLARVWQKPLDGLYQRVLAWLNTDPARVGPWAQAATVTIALLAPRVVPRLLDRFLPAPRPDPAPDAKTRSEQ